LKSKQLDLLQEKKYTRLGKDGKVYRISESEALSEERVEVVHESEWDQHIRKANELGKAATKIHRQMYFTNKDTVLPMLRRAYRLAMLKYTEQIVVLAHISPDYIRRLYAACLERQHFLERKFDMMQKVRKEQMFEQLQKTLVQYEVIHVQVQTLLIGYRERRNNNDNR